MVKYNCDACGEPLYDGDTAYSLVGMMFCPACVNAALTVFRPQSWEVNYTTDQYSANTLIDGIPHREITAKTREKHPKANVNSRFQKG